MVYFHFYKPNIDRKYILHNMYSHWHWIAEIILNDLEKKFTNWDYQKLHNSFFKVELPSKYLFD